MTAPQIEDRYKSRAARAEASSDRALRDLSSGHHIAGSAVGLSDPNQGASGWKVIPRASTFDL